MNHGEMVGLIRGGVTRPGGVWADLGAGTGNFTRALAKLLGTQGIIYALDRDARVIAAQRAHVPLASDAATIIPQQSDVTQTLTLPPLDGMLLANLLHFIRDQEGLLRRLADYLKPDGRLLIVEYEQALPIAWVPFPVPFARFASLVQDTGFGEATQIGTRRSPSSGRVLYAASVVLRGVSLPVTHQE